MDTHYSHLEPEPLLSPRAQLPDEPDLYAATHPEPDPSSVAPPVSPAPSPARKRKRRLLAGVSVVAVLSAGGAAFLLSPLNTFVPLPPAVTALADDASRYVSSLAIPARASVLVNQATQAVVGLLPQGQTQSAEPGTISANADAASSTRTPRSVQREPLVAPAASLAATRVPARPDAISAAPYTPKPHDQSLNELLQLRPNADATARPSAPSPSALPVSTTAPSGSAPAAATPSDASQPSRPVAAALPANTAREPGAASNAVPTAVASAEPAVLPLRTSSATPVNAIPEPGMMPAEPGPAVRPQQLDITGAVTGAALGQPTNAVPPQTAPTSPTAPSPNAAIVTSFAAPPEQPVAAANPMPATPETKPVTSASPTLVLAVPAGHQEQAEVLQFVTGLSGEIARLRSENETFRKDFARRSAEQESRMADLNRRVSVAEARAALRSAADAGKRDEPEADSTSRLVAAPVTAPPLQVVAARPSTQPASPRPRYHVQAASPGLALLAEIGRGGGDGAQLQVAVGDQVPGYGVVKSVAQRGPNWVVQTERGPID